MKIFISSDVALGMKIALHAELTRTFKMGFRDHVGRPVYLAPGQRWNLVTSNLFFLRWYYTRAVTPLPSPQLDAPKYLQKSKKNLFTKRGEREEKRGEGGNAFSLRRRWAVLKEEASPLNISNPI